MIGRRHGGSAEGGLDPVQYQGEVWQATSPHPLQQPQEVVIQAVERADAGGGTCRPAGLKREKG